MQTMESKEFSKFENIVGITEAKAFIEKSTQELEEIYSSYYVDLKRGMDDLKENNEQYIADALVVKDIKSAMAERIKPEKRLFELALFVLDLNKKGRFDLSLVRESKQYKSAEKMSGKSYTMEFIHKDSSDLKDFCVRFYMLQNEIKEELSANLEYQVALDRKKSAENGVRSNLSDDEIKAKLAIVELKNRKNFEMDVAASGNS